MKELIILSESEELVNFKNILERYASDIKEDVYSELLTVFDELDYEIRYEYENRIEELEQEIEDLKEEIEELKGE